MPVLRSTYTGRSRQLLLAFDVGTTFSGISYCVLDPGEVPRIQGVTRFPAQEHQGGNSKIPSLIYYNRHGEVKAIGAEALLSINIENAENEGWYILQWWKLLMAPKELVEGLDKSSPPPLPPNKSITDVFSDFLAYLFRCAEQFISDSHAGGSSLWNSVRPGIQFILTHPNGWEGAQQSLMRDAAVRAGLVPDTEDGKSRIVFVTEGEASFNYCATNSLSIDAFKENQKILVIDAGGGTVDISAYSITSSSPLSVEEMFPPDCLMQGSEFVTFRATDYVQRKLESSKFDTPEDLHNITTNFDMSVKRLFRDRDESVYIKFGSPRDKDTARGISGGKLKLSGTEVASFFEESVNSIVDTVNKYLIRGNTEVFLVGGFAASPWLFKQLQEEFQPLGLTVSRPDGHTNKAVADGAISFYLDHFVSSRVAKYTYGTSHSQIYNPHNHEHHKRRRMIHESLSGDIVISNAFSSILCKNVKVSTTEEFFAEFNFIFRASSSHISTAIFRYQGSHRSPRWMDVDSHFQDMFSTLCHIEADISAVPKVIKRNKSGVLYFEQLARVVLLFGSTELKAQLCWDQDGEEKRGPAKVIYDRD